MEGMDICVYGGEEVDESAWNGGWKESVSVTLSALKTKTHLCWSECDCIYSAKSVCCAK